MQISAMPSTMQLYVKQVVVSALNETINFLPQEFAAQWKVKACG